ncbi:MAG: plasmid mobilization relaxosome protein MobC [Silvanigrellaceae bacterium]|nr:plasmid mobilization relaxosome protein MobC [Silvanigrellaceae bacterium]
MLKTKPLIVRVTEKESELVEKASIQLFGRPNKSRYLRKLVRDNIGMGIDLTEQELKVFREAVRQLTGIARNLNQITSRINADSKQLSQLSTDYLERINLRVLAINDKLKHYIFRTISRDQEVVNHDD